MNACHYCGELEDLRPYGPGGAWVCFPCANATPERQDDTKRAFGALLEASEAASPTGTTILTSEGPQPFDARTIDPTAPTVDGDD